MENNRHSRRGFLLKSGLGLTSMAAFPLSAAIAGERPEQEKQFALRFAVSSDGHFGQPDTPFQRYHTQMVDWLNEEAMGKGLDFVVFNGDLIHDDPAFLPQVKPFFDRLTVPYYTTKGNHDRVTDEEWKKTWGYEINHSVELGDYAILLGNTSNVAGDYLCADLPWFEKAIKRLAQKKHVFVFLHICQSGLTANSVQCEALMNLFKVARNVTAVFHGHDHDMDQLVFVQGIPCLFDGHMGGSWGTGYRGYRIVEINAEGQLSSYQCNPEAFRVNQAKLARR
jgi:hypothetical protein